MQNALKCSHSNEFVFIFFILVFTEIQQQEIVFNKNTGKGVNTFYKDSNSPSSFVETEQCSQWEVLLQCDLPIQNKSPNSFK